MSDKQKPETGRIKTPYRGVFYRVSKRIGGRGSERIYYVVFKKNRRVYEEKAGRQYADDMTPARAALYRAERIEGKRPSRKDVREQEEAEKKAEADRWTFNRLWEEYKKANPSLKGLRTDDNRFKKHIKPLLGDEGPGTLTPLDLDRLRLKSLKGRQPATLRNVLELVRRLVNFGAKRDLCPATHFKIEMPKVNNLKTEDLSSHQVKVLLAAIAADAHPQAGPIMKAALVTGMRRGELFKLKWDDIDFDRGFITIRDPKGGRDQKIPLNQAARVLFRSQPRTDSPHVFPGRGGRQRADINKAINRIKEEAGLPKSFRPLHGLRHVYASMLASSGQVDMYTLQKLLTHRTPTMTQRYAHLRDDALRKASELAGEIIRQAGGAQEHRLRSSD